MLDDKWVGILLALSGSLGIGMSAVITKKGLNAATASAVGENTVKASDNYTYLKNPIWWAGMTTQIVGELANFAAYTFAPPILITPLGGLSVLTGAILASFLLNEELGHLGRLGCTVSLIGSLIIVLNAPEDKDIKTVDQILEYALEFPFVLFVLISTLLSLFLVYHSVPKYGRTNPLYYVSICSLVGSISVMAIKGFGVAVKLTFEGENQFTRPSTYVFGLVTAFCIIVQMNYYNKALDTFSVNIVNSMYYVGFSTCTIIASLILFQGFNTDTPTASISLIAGFAITFIGVHILNLSRKAEPPSPLDVDPETPGGGSARRRRRRSALEGGLMNPRLSLGGRVSVDGWHEFVESHSPRTPRSASWGSTHGRRSSLYRSQTATLFDAFEGGEGEDPEPPRGGGALGLHQLREESEDEDDEGHDANERTHFTPTRNNRNFR